MRSAYAALRSFCISGSQTNLLLQLTAIRPTFGNPVSDRMSSLYLQQDNIVRFKRRKARFSFSEVHILLDEVRKNRHIVVGKFNAGVPADVKRRKWAEITARVNEIGESDREIMEVIKKWSDLKCDTKRKVAVLRNGGTLSMRLARNHIELSPAELIVESILDLKKKSWDATPHTSSYGVREDQEVLGEDEEEEDVGFMGMESVSSSPGRGGEMGGTQALTSRPLLYNGPKTGDMESHMVDSDEDSHQHFASSSAAASSNSCSEENSLAFRDSSRQRVSSTASAKTTPSFSATEPDSVREQMMNNAHRSVQEQHTSNTLLTAVSHSLEVLAESVQQLAETQQQFVQESLQLQRETVQVLQEFTSGALTIIREKVNGKPVL